MVKRLNGRVIVATVLLFGAAFSVYSSCRKLPPLPLVIISERIILESADSSIPGGREMALSPVGRHVLFVRQEAPNADKGGTAGMEKVRQPFLLDIATGKEVRLPIAPLQPIQNLPGWMDGPFTPNGQLLHELDPLAADGSVVSDCLLVYDIRNDMLQKFTVGLLMTISNDASGEHVWITTQKQKEFDKYWEHLWDATFQITRVSLSGGAGEPYDVNGVVWGAVSCQS